MIFCGMALAPGRKVRVPLPVPGAQPLETLCLCGAAPGRTLVVTAGVHGCEYVGVQALRRLAVELDPNCLETSSSCPWPIPLAFTPELNRWCRRTEST